MKIIALIMSIGMFGLGVLQTFIYLRLKKTFESWPIVCAEITHSRLLDQLGMNGEEMLEAIIFYKYEFRGKEYEVNTPALRGYDLFPSRNYEAGLVTRYKQGEFHNVRVHPRLPRVAYLEVAPLSSWSMFLVPVLCIGGILLLVAYFHGLSKILNLFS